MSDRMSQQELMTGVPDTAHKRIVKAMGMLERSRPPEGLISAAADTYPYVKHAIIAAVRSDADKIKELENLLHRWSDEYVDGMHPEDAQILYTDTVNTLG